VWLAAGTGTHMLGAPLPPGPTLAPAGAAPASVRTPATNRPANPLRGGIVMYAPSCRLSTYAPGGQSSSLAAEESSDALSKKRPRGPECSTIDLEAAISTRSRFCTVAPAAVSLRLPLPAPSGSCAGVTASGVIRQRPEARDECFHDLSGVRPADSYGDAAVVGISSRPSATALGRSRPFVRRRGG
jgi:hypothetical protein